MPTISELEHRLDKLALEYYCILNETACEWYGSEPTDEQLTYVASTVGAEWVKALSRVLYEKWIGE